MSGPVRLPFETGLHPRLGPIRKPGVRAFASGPAGSVQCKFTLDSGADTAMIPRSLGEAIGLSDQGAPRGECRGIGKATVAYCLCSMEVRIGDLRLPVRVAWSTVDEAPLLLGRLDLFDMLDIEFRQSSNEIVLRPAGGVR